MHGAFVIRAYFGQRAFLAALGDYRLGGVFAGFVFRLVGQFLALWLERDVVPAMPVDPPKSIYIPISLPKRLDICSPTLAAPHRRA
jgi:hypothetical protein